MNIILVNKFLRPVGGAETYLLKLGAYLASEGHRVSCFGMHHPENCVGNDAGLETAQMDFHGGGMLSKLTYPTRVIYSAEARRKLLALLEREQPDVLHLNNFNYQLTPSVLLAARDYREKTGQPLRVVCTAHDCQLVCPGHLMFRPDEGTVCEACIDGNVLPCIANRCIHGSRLRSMLGAAEAVYWRAREVYRLIDAVICPSQFMARTLAHNPHLAGRTTVLRNFVTRPVSAVRQVPAGEGYVLYFGRYAEEKGLRTLLEVCRALPQIPFVFAGAGPLAHLMADVPNVKNLGFLSGEALETVIRGARFSVCPSECNENCPFSVMESIMEGTPVLGADRGGIPELIEEGKTGWLFPAGDAAALRTAVETLWNSTQPEEYATRCAAAGEAFDDLPAYAARLTEIYRGGM